MLLKVSKQIAECLRRAEQARQRADETINPQICSDYLEIEGHWVNLAESYRLVEQLDHFLNDVVEQLDHFLNDVERKRREELR
jgi:hypothetical protein